MLIGSVMRVALKAALIGCCSYLTGGAVGDCPRSEMFRAINIDPFRPSGYFMYHQVEH